MPQDYASIMPNYNLTTGYGGIPYNRTSGQQFGLNDVLKPLQSPVSADYSRIDALMKLRGGDSFQKGLDLLQPDYINSPETKQLLDNIRGQGDLAYKNLTSTASALAGRRGLSGSSIEQFGVQQAGMGAQQATIDAQNQILLQAAQRQQAARDLAAQALFGRAGQETSLQQTALGGEFGMSGTLAGLESGRKESIANLTSDELASIRNMVLGNQATQLGYANVNQANQASKRANNPLNLLIGGAASGATAAIAPF